MRNKRRILLLAVALGVVGSAALTTLEFRDHPTTAVDNQTADTGQALDQKRDPWIRVEAQLEQLQSQLARASAGQGDLTSRLRALEQRLDKQTPGPSLAQLDERIVHSLRQELATFERDVLVAPTTDDELADQSASLTEEVIEARDYVEAVLDDGRVSGELDDKQMIALAEHVGSLDRDTNKAFWEQFHAAVETGELILPADSE